MQIFFEPADDAELYHEQVEREGIPEDKIAQHFHGGPFAGKFFGGNLNKTLNSGLEGESAFEMREDFYLSRIVEKLDR